MADISETQRQVLTAAADRPGRMALPLPPNVRGGAAKKVVAAMLARGLLAEVPFGRNADDIVWQTDPDTTLIATRAGLEAIGIPSAAEPPVDAPNTRAGTKQAKVIEMLRAREGATIAEISEETNWQHHTIRGFFASALKKRLGLAVTSEKVEGRGRVYNLPAEG